MTAYSFRPLSSTQFVNWSDPAIWVGGVVPNEPTADVDFPLVTRVDSGQPYVSFITIAAGESYAVKSIALRDYLLVSGRLDVGGALRQYQDGNVALSGGVLTVGSLANEKGFIEGNGVFTAGALVNGLRIQATGGTLTVNATGLENAGTLAASPTGALVMNVTPGGFANFVGGVLTGGAYQASGTIAINSGGVIAVNAADIVLQGGMITSRDPASGADIPLTASLTDVAAAGSLAIAGDYVFDELEVAGKLILTGSSTFAADDLDIAPGGRLQGVGTVGSAIDNDGIISASVVNGARLVLNGAITGDGILQIEAPIVSNLVRGGMTTYATLELNGPTSQDVVFAGNGGTLQLGQPLSYTGAITSSGDASILLQGIGLNSITGLSYSGNATGGVLELQRAAGAILLTFDGNYSAASFTLAAGPQRLSIDPPSLLVNVSGSVGGFEVRRDFDGDSDSDMLWRRSDGLVTTWASSGGGANDNTALLRPVGLDWRVQGTGDFNGDGRTDILWRNDSGLVTDWLATGGGGFADNAAASRQVGGDWRIEGTGDFNGDGRSDVLWRRSDGLVTDWLSDGAGFQDNVPAFRTVGLDWQIQGTGDFNGDGRDEVLWRHASGFVTAWRSTGIGFDDNLAMSRESETAWSIVGTGDFDGNGATDILWRRSDGLVTNWFSDGTRFVENPTLLRPVGIDWQVQDTGDYNGDGRTDILWRRADGLVTNWFATGDSFADNAGLLRPVNNDWSVIGA